MDTATLLHGIKLIAFDADDTLWPCQRHYNDIIARYATLLRPWISADEAHASLYHTETQRLPLTGYGVKAFTLSLIENALTATHHRVTPEVLEAILHLGYELMEMPITPNPDVRPTLSALRDQGYQLILLTKGELLDQQRKIDRSGLRPLFHATHIVTHKDTDTYRHIAHTYHVQPQQALMVGDSLKSDILPAHQAGWHTAYLPNDEAWQHEQATHIPPQCLLISGFAHLIDLLCILCLICPLCLLYP